MKTVLSAPDKEKGYVMIIALMILALVTAIGVMSRKSSITEVQIATNDLNHKITFFEAEGGTELASELLEQNISCPNGFYTEEEGQDFVQTGTFGDETITVVVPGAYLKFWDLMDIETPSDENHNISIYHHRAFYSYDESRSHTNITVSGVTRFSRGAALQIAAGYEGKGKSAAGGGAHIFYTINSQHKGSGRSESLVRIEWQHNLGQEGDCLYVD